MSRQLLKAALYSTNQLFKRASDLSFKTRHDYALEVKLSLTQLHEGGFQLSHVSHLKQRHIAYLVSRWQHEALNPATILNRISCLRYVAKAINKPTIILSNDALGLKPRAYTSKINKALVSLDLNRFTDPYIRHAVRLQQLFGLRREESMKFIISEAYQGHQIKLKGSWTKGGIPRSIPITTGEQRAFLEELKQCIPAHSSLIPLEKSYRQQENTYISQVRLAGYRNLHGLRHAYAQQRYAVLTAELSAGVGWACPRAGGPKSVLLTPEQKHIDILVRRMISEELGHSRMQIVSIYI